MRVAGVLLAAGLSRRFGGDKLSRPFAGLPLGLHAARALMGIPLAMRIAVVGRDGPNFAAEGFALCRNPAPEEGQGRSLALGVAAARSGGADAVLVALADMPLVDPAHLADLLSRISSPRSRVASTDGDRVMPPAGFGAAWFPSLEALRGDRGARALLDGATLVAASAATLADVDTAGDLARLPPRAASV